MRLRTSSCHGLLLPALKLSDWIRGNNLLNAPEQLSLEEYARGLALKEQGMIRAADACPDWLERAREVARHLAMKNGETEIESVYGVVGLPDRPNAAGSVFRGKEWRCIGWRKALRSSRHAGSVRRWSLVEVLA